MKLFNMFWEAVPVPWPTFICTKLVDASITVIVPGESIADFDIRFNPRLFGESNFISYHQRMQIFQKRHVDATSAQRSFE